MDGPRNNLRLLFLCEEWLPEIRALNGSRNGRSSEKAQVVGRPGETRIGNSSKRREYSPNGVLRGAEYNLLEIVFFQKTQQALKFVRYTPEAIRMASPLESLELLGKVRVDSSGTIPHCGTLEEGQRRSFLRREFGCE